MDLSGALCLDAELPAPSSAENLQCDGGKDGSFFNPQCSQWCAGSSLPLTLAVFFRKRVGSARGCGRST